MHRIAVHPLSLGPDQLGSSEIFCAFYPLGCLVAYAKADRDGWLRERFAFGRITPTQEREIPALLSRWPEEPGIVLLSCYVWNHAINMRVAAEVKRRSPGSLVVVGGPHVPRQPEPARRYFAAHPYVDVAARHEGEPTLAELLAAIARSGAGPEDLRRVDLSGVAGLTVRRNGDLLRTPDRPRATDLAAYPSPYTTGEFDPWITDRVYVPLESNRGCPYGCTFCDWGAATLSKVTRLSMERVLAEVDYVAAHRIHTIGFCDANFGILPRDLDIVRHIVATKERTGYPREVGYTNAKTAHPRLTEIIKTLRDAGLTAAAQISMQTTDETVLRNVERDNIKTSEYRKMIAFFHREDIPAVSDMMVGLPGQTPDTCQRDLQFLFDHKVLAVIFATSVMPNAPMADEDYRARFAITIGADGMVESTYSFTREDYAHMFELCLAYKLFVKLGLLKYLLYFAQVEHGVPAMEFVRRWLAVTAAHPERYPLSTRVRRELIGRDYTGGRKDWLVLAWSDAQARFLFDDLPGFQAETLAFFAREHGVRLAGSDVDAVLAANRAVLPQKGRALPARVPLAHDVPGYFADLRRVPSLADLPADHVPLARRGPGVLELAAQPPCTTYDHVDVGLTLGGLELRSNLRI
ncbi:MAG TPA: radical SAM protein [Candidatus Limnocylindria bacterium]|nr:radical SAM protein [Candidatus Limnocylindria bacterium]